MDANETGKPDDFLNSLDDFVGGDVIVNFIEPNVANRRGVILNANTVFITFQSMDDKKLMIPWAAISYISKEF